MSYSAIGIKFPLATYESIKETLPDATVYRTLTSLSNDGFIEIFYILDSEVFSQAQIKWYANIKTIICRKLIDLNFELVELDKEAHVRALSGVSFTLKSLSNTWKKAKVKKENIQAKLTDKKWIDNELLEDNLVDDVIVIPQLVPLTYFGKEHENLYQTLCIYAKRLFYEKLFIYEYLELASHIYVKGMDLLPKEARKITLKAWEFISEQIELNPEDFKQKLKPEELKAVKSAHGKRLQQYNQAKRTDNTKIVQDAIDSGKCLKANGTIHIGQVAKYTNLNRKTVEKILDN